MACFEYNHIMVSVLAQIRNLYNHGHIHTSIRVYHSILKKKKYEENNEKKTVKFWKTWE